MAKLRETMPFTYRFLEADDDQKKRGILGVVEGTFQRADTENANKRIYSRGLWEKVLQTPDVKERLQARGMVGELDHPQSGASRVERVSHVVTEMGLQEDGVIKGRAEILDTPHGRIAETLFRSGVRVGISSRGDGTIREEGGKQYVNESDYKLETYDFVMKPSTPGAYPALTEEEQLREDTVILEAVQGLVNNSTDPKILLESSKILSCLRGSPAEQQAALSRSIQDKLVALYESLVPAPPPTSPQQEEPLMPKNADGTDTSQNLEALARDLAESKIVETQHLYERKLTAKDRQIAEMAGQLSKLTREYNAAESLVEELLRKVEETKRTAPRTAVAEVQRRYNAAAKLLEVALQKMKPLAEGTRRYVAARGLLESMLLKHSDLRVLRHIDSIVRAFPEAQRERVFNILREAKTIRGVNMMWEQMRKLGVGTRLYEDRRQPLPSRTAPRAAASLLEHAATKTPGAALVDRLVEKAQHRKVVG